MSISRTQVRVSDARAAHSEEVDRAEYELLWFTLARSLFVSVRRTQYYKHKQRQLHAIAMNERNEPPTESGLFCAVIYDTPDLNRNQRQSESNEAQEKAQWKYDYSWMNGRRTLLITASDSYGKQNSFITSTKPEKHLRIIDHLINYYAWHQSDDYQTIERFDQLSCECSTQKKVLKRKKGNTNLVDWMAAHEQRLWFYPLPCLLNFYLFRNFSLQFLLLLLQLLFNLYIYSLIHLIAMILFIDTQTLAHWN